MISRKAALLIALAAPWSQVFAQTPSDSLRLSTLRNAAVTTDPRAAQIRLLESQSALRLQNIGADLRPTLSVDGLAQYQSDVTNLKVDLPGITLPTPAHDSYDARLGAQQKIFDPSIGPRRAVERAQLAESQARVKTSLYALMESVNSAFYTALRAQMQIAEMETTLTDLEAQLKIADARVNAGTALASESNSLRAELLRRRQSISEQRASRVAAIAILSDLTGRRIDPTIPLAIPSLATEAAVTRTSLDSIRRRPEYEQFARTREVLRQNENARAAQDLPRVVAFGRIGYGRPGLNPLSDKFDTYWLSGIQLQWTPWNWGTTSRDRQAAELQRQIVTTEEQAFTAQLQRSVETDLATIDRLEASVKDDDEIIALRESVLTETRARFRESVITSAEYVDRQTDVLSARLSRAIHRVELSQARAHLLNTLGIEVR
jgi:outer membrane protein TolC